MSVKNSFHPGELSKLGGNRPILANALAVCKGCVNVVEGPYTPTPRITTGAGDHFNSGFCLGKLLGFDDAFSLLAGVATSGHYVRMATSPTLADLARILRNWPDANPQANNQL